jgi:hypothetical protein
VLAASIIRVMSTGTGTELLMTEEASISETSVNLYQTTRRSNPEGSHLNEDEVCAHAFHLSENTE